MAEGNRVTESSKRPSLPKRLILVLAGTAGVLALSAVLFQVFRADSSESPTDLSAGEVTAAAATARVSDAGKRPLARVVRGVSSRSISEDEVARECMQRVGKEVLDSIINRTVIELACEEQGVSVTKQEVDQEIARIASEFNIDVANWYQVLQSERNLTPFQYQRDVIWPMLALKKLAGETVTISDDDMQKAFIQNYGPRVKAKMIMLENLRRAKDVWNKAMKNPDDFPRLAREYSCDPNSKALDGSIHPIPRYSGNEELENAAFRLKKGEISGIIQVPYGTSTRYVILRCEGRTEQVVTDINDVRETLQHDLMKIKIQESVAKVFEKVKSETRVDNYLTKTSTGGAVRQASGTTGGRVRPAAATTTR